MKYIPSAFMDETVNDTFCSGNKKVFNFSVYTFRDGKVSIFLLYKIVIFGEYWVIALRMKL